jgi:hypothetical protein
MRGKLHVRICEGGVERSTPPLDPIPAPSRFSAEIAPIAD